MPFRPSRTDVLYNIPLGQAWPREVVSGSQRQECSELLLDEALRVSSQCSELLYSFWRAGGFDAEDAFLVTQYDEESARYAGWYDEVPLDRTVETPIDDPGYFRPELVSLLQDFLRTSWPCWRVRACASTPGAVAERSYDLLIYPDQLWVGDSCCTPHVDDAALMDWVGRYQALWEPFKGPKRRQIRHVRTMVANLMSGAAPGGVPLALCAFDNHEGDYRRNPVWILSDAHTSDFIPEYAPLSHGKSFGVSRDGSLYTGGLYDGDLRLSEWICGGPLTKQLKMNSGSRSVLLQLPEITGDFRLR